jgi:O-antigen/teichoic acid export membrane protein
MTRTPAESPAAASPVPRPPAPSTGPDKGLSGLARGGALSLVGSAVSAVTGIVLVLAVTRSLPPDIAGTFFALTSVFLIAEGVSRLGTGTGLVWAISRSRALGTTTSVPAVLRVALTPVGLLSVALGAVLFAGADTVAGLVGGDSGSGAAAAVRILAVLLPLTALSDTLVAATRGYGTVRPTVLLDRLGRPLVQLLAVAAVAATGSIALLSSAWALPWVGCAVLAAWWLRRLQPARDTGAEPVPAPWREFWRFTGPRALTSVVQLALQRLDIVLLTLLAGPTEAAVYTAATRFLVVGQIVNQGLAAVVEPRLGGLLAVGDRSAAAAVYRTATGWLVLICWPLYLLAATYADVFLGWFGSDYTSGTPVVLVLVGAMLIATSVGMVDVVLIMGGRTSWNLANSVTALAVNVLVDLLLIPHLGLLGAAIGWAAAIGVNNVLPLAQVWRHMSLHPFGAGTGTAVALAAGCFGLLPLLARAVWNADPLTALLTTAAGSALFLLGCWRRRHVLALDSLRTLRRVRSGAAGASPVDAPRPVR